jgi:hypothetical protein
MAEQPVADNNVSTNTTPQIHRLARDVDFHGVFIFTSCPATTHASFGLTASDLWWCNVWAFAPRCGKRLFCLCFVC